MSRRMVCSGREDAGAGRLRAGCGAAGMLRMSVLAAHAQAVNRPGENVGRCQSQPVVGSAKARRFSGVPVHLRGPGRSTRTAGSSRRLGGVEVEVVVLPPRAGRRWFHGKS